MKKYRFYINELVYMDLTEEQYNELEDCNCSFEENGLKVEGKIIKGESYFEHKYPIMIITPKENFKVLDIVSEITAPAIEYKDSIWSKKE